MPTFDRKFHFPVPLLTFGTKNKKHKVDLLRQKKIAYKTSYDPKSIIKKKQKTNFGHLIYSKITLLNVQSNTNFDRKFQFSG